MGEGLQRGQAGGHPTETEVRASTTGAAGGQAPKGLGGASAVPSAPTSNPTALVIQATSFVLSGMATQGRDG